MAGYKVSDYGLNDHWAELLETIEKQRKGYIGLSLTNYANNSLPAIEAGGFVEIVGALYGFSSEEAIGGTPTDNNLNYIMVDPTPVTASWTTTAPVWIANKNGWYNAAETKRYVGECYRDGVEYRNKRVYDENRDIRSLVRSGMLGHVGVKIGNFNRTTAESDTQIITDVGFELSVAIFFANDQIGANMNWSKGFDDGVIHHLIRAMNDDGSVQRSTSESISIVRGSGAHLLSGYISAKSPDGCTITWSAKIGTVQLNCVYLFFP